MKLALWQIRIAPQWALCWRVVVDKRRGPLATVLVQNGTLKTGDVVVVGNTWGKIRALEDENDVRHRTAPPATPTVVIGLHDVPEAGDRLEVVPDERTARAIAEKRQQETRAKDLARARPDAFTGQFFFAHP